MNEEKYTNFEAVDFAQESSFIHYVKNSDATAVSFWEDWIAKHPEKKPETDIARKLVVGVYVKESPVESGQLDRIWNKIEEETREEAITRQLPARRSVIRRWMGVAAAACVLIMLGIVFWPKNQAIQVAAAKQLLHTLPDGSEVTINADSELTFNEKDWEKNRTLTLEGEAFFEVKKGSRFLVNTQYGSVEVLGTSFNVYARADAFAVDCFTGKVQVKSKQGQAQILSKGFGTHLEQQQLVEPQSFKEQETATWRSGAFYYEGVQLERVFAELERQFDIEIEASPEAKQKTGTLYFDRSSLDTALYKITWPMGLTATRNGKTVVIK